MSLGMANGGKSAEMTDKEIYTPLEDVSIEEEYEFYKKIAEQEIQKMHDENRELKAEIEKLTINMNAFGLGMKREKERADQIKAEAIKEYMKILEEKLSQNTDISNVGYQSIIFDMEQGYKEMVGEGNG